jgi:DNA mismatch repair ATPase MutS
MLFLLDELFRGTNSIDRHDGAVMLLRELSRPHTLGLVSTHDLELCSLAHEHPQFRNYHFEEHYDGGGLNFDYLLKEGPSTTRNAMYLMRMVGIGKKKNGDA